MKMKKLVSAIAALAMSVSAFAGMAITAQAAITIYENDFETASDFTAGGKEDAYIVNPGISSGNTNGTNIIGRAAGSGDANLTSPSFSAMESYAGAELVNVSFDFKIDAGQQGKGSSLALLGGTSGSAWLNSNQQILTFAISNSGNGRFGSLAVNGEDIKGYLLETGIHENGWDDNRDTTGWVTLNAAIDLKAKQVTYSLTKGEKEVLSRTVDFVNKETAAFDRIFLASNRGYGGIFLDNIKVEKAVAPKLALAADAATVTVGGTTTVDVTDLVGTVDVKSADETKAKASYADNKVTIEGIGDGVTILTVTATSDGSSVSKDITVTVGAVTKTTVTLNHKAGVVVLKDADTVTEFPVGDTLDLTPYSGIVTSYTDPANGVVYTVTYAGPESFVVTEENQSYDLTYTLTENTYATTVTTAPFANVAITGTSTTGADVNVTLKSDYTGTAVTNLPAGTYNVAVSKGGYTAGTATVDAGATATVAVAPTEADVLYIEDYSNNNGSFYGIQSYAGDKNNWARYEKGGMQIIGGGSGFRGSDLTFVYPAKTYDVYTMSYNLSFNDPKPESNTTTVNIYDVAGNVLGTMTYTTDSAQSGNVVAATINGVEVAAPSNDTVVTVTVDAATGKVTTTAFGQTETKEVANASAPTKINVNLQRNGRMTFDNIKIAGSNYDTDAYVFEGIVIEDFAETALCFEVETADGTDVKSTLLSSFVGTEVSGEGEVNLGIVIVNDVEGATVNKVWLDVDADGAYTE